MSIEILDDIIEELADSLGIYGAHTEEHPDGQCECRVCFSMGMSRRIRDAVQIERQLAAPPPDPELIDVIGIMGALKEATEALKPKRKRRLR